MMIDNLVITIIFIKNPLHFEKENEIFLYAWIDIWYPSPHFDFVNHMLDKSSQTLVNNVYILYQKVLKSVI